ncbi:hypothetical protein M885DRAFT_581300 [Pelagophyceae sp. CCMP2097]|nr:hypothetical protein M885DRAFT_581300 [Pelagophyceae sp. CCMP2097]
MRGAAHLARGLSARGLGGARFRFSTALRTMQLPPPKTADPSSTPPPLVADPPTSADFFVRDAPAQFADFFVRDLASDSTEAGLRAAFEAICEVRHRPLD